MRIFPSRHLLLHKNGRDSHLAARCQTRFDLEPHPISHEMRQICCRTRYFLSAQMQRKRMTASGPRDVTAAHVTGGARGRNTLAATGCSRPRKRCTLPSPAGSSAAFAANARCPCLRWRRLENSIFGPIHLQRFAAAVKDMLIFFGGRARLTITFIHTKSGAVLHPMYVRACAWTCFHWNAARRRLLFGGARGGKFIRTICHFDWHQAPRARHIRRILIFAAAADENIAEMQTRRRAVKVAPEWWI